MNKTLQKLIELILRATLKIYRYYSKSLPLYVEKEEDLIYKMIFYK